MNTMITTNLGAIATYINGRAFKPAEWGKQGLPIVRIANLSSPVAPFDYYDGPMEQGHRIDDGDIVVSWSATLDASIWTGGKAALNQHIFKVIPKENIIDPDYLYFVLKRAMHGLSELVHGATMKHVTRPEFEEFGVQIVKKKEEQRRIAARLKAQLGEVEAARNAAEAQLSELGKLANSIIHQSIEQESNPPVRLGDVLIEVKAGIGSSWSDYPVLGATRGGLAPAKEPVGKKPERYKPAFPGTVFYNPMRILIGSIAFVDDDDEPGITSPDYVVVQGKANLVDSRWFYYWLRSPYGEQCISSLARGAVRERMLFNRLSEGTINLPLYSAQLRVSEALKELKSIKYAVEKQLKEINLMPIRLLSKAFEIDS